MGLLSLAKPEYLLRPAQLFRRIRNHLSPVVAKNVVTRLPWGWPIEVHPSEVIGRCILNIGVYDLVVSELLWRLCDPGETVVDAGANIGYMTSIMANRVGPQGRVFSFEAHPEVATELKANVERWTAFPASRSVKVMALALSDHEGEVRFEVPEDFATNRGLSRVAGSESSPSSKTITVPCARLESVLENAGPIGVIKMDVEGHEEAVLKGASALMKARGVREWIFEHHESYPSAVTQFLEKHGYTVLQVKKLFFGPALIPVTEPIPSSPWEPQSYIATLDPARAIERVKSAGWRSLG